MVCARGRRVLIDGTMARGGGGFTYLVNILPLLAAVLADDIFRVLLRSERLAAALPPLANVELELLPDVGWPGRMRFTYRELPRLFEQWGADLYFSAGESAPLRAPCPMIASFRNPIIYTNLDLGVGWKQRLRLRLLREVSRLSARSCDRILFVSENSAGWMGDSVGVAPGKRRVVHHGVDVKGWARPPGEAPPPYGFPYILSVSSIYTHKNFVRLIEAYALLGRRGDPLPDLVIVGDVQHPDYLSQMQQARVAAGPELVERIHFVGEVPYAEIKTCYAGAELFVFPSYLESFGHPLLEAMASGAPVVAADIPVFREIAGDAALYADPHKTEALADAIHEALHSQRARQALIQRGGERVRGFTWEASARALASLFDEALAAA